WPLSLQLHLFTAEPDSIAERDANDPPQARGHRDRARRAALSPARPQHHSDVRPVLLGHAVSAAWAFDAEPRELHAALRMDRRSGGGRLFPARPCVPVAHALR